MILATPRQNGLVLLTLGHGEQPQVKTKLRIKNKTNKRELYLELLNVYNILNDF
jgi:hypothetical protein